MINADHDFRTIWEDTNWPWAMDNLINQFHDSASRTAFFGEIEDIFFFGKKIDNPDCKSLFESCDQWIGISHQHRKYLRQNDLPNNQIRNYLDKCRCIITLSEYMKDYWHSVFSDVSVVTLFHPCPNREKQFDLRVFLEKGYVRSLGQNGRTYVVWQSLESPYEKLPSTRDNYLSWHEFDKTFVNTIQFIDLDDASANNGVIECIRRNTPLLICEHPAVIEYLGRDYPFYFSNLEDANSKINNPKLIIQTHEYLKNMNKNFIDIDSFLESFLGILNEKNENAQDTKRTSCAAIT